MCSFHGTLFWVIYNPPVLIFHASESPAFSLALPMNYCWCTCKKVSADFWELLLSAKMQNTMGFSLKKIVNHFRIEMFFVVSEFWKKWNLKYSVEMWTQSMFHVQWDRPEAVGYKTKHTPCFMSNEIHQKQLVIATIQGS